MFAKHALDLYHVVAASVYTAREGKLHEREAFLLARQLLQPLGTVYVIGNGGSAGIASHFATDLMKTLKIRAQTFYDSNLMTCLANDYGYEHVFSYPTEKLIKPEDTLVAISSSGKSPNIVNAARIAVEKGARLITLSGFAEDNPLRALGDLNIWLNKKHYGFVETGHALILHTLIDLWSVHELSGHTTENQEALRN